MLEEEAAETQRGRRAEHPQHGRGVRRAGGERLHALEELDHEDRVAAVHDQRKHLLS